MKQQVQQPAPVSRTLQGKAKASSQASVSDVLQAYKNGIFQRQVVDEDELLQGKFETTQRDELDDDELLQGKFETAQRDELEDNELLQGKFETVQRDELEDDELLQGKFETTQRDELEDDELLQGKFETAQRDELEDDELLQGKFETAQRDELEDDELLQGKFETAQRQEAPNNTGLPENLKAGVEQLSGLDMSDVKVHYNSSKPASIQAYAYTQGTDIHVAPRQEQHLGHEAWHVAQQKQGRVQPTTSVNGIAVNDNVGLESEADVMGGKAVQMKVMENISSTIANSVGQKKSDGKRCFDFVDNRPRITVLQREFAEATCKVKDQIVTTTSKGNYRRNWVSDAMNNIAEVRPKIINGEEKPGNKIFQCAEPKSLSQALTALGTHEQITEEELNGIQWTSIVWRGSDRNGQKASLCPTCQTWITDTDVAAKPIDKAKDEVRKRGKQLCKYFNTKEDRETYNKKTEAREKWQEDIGQYLEILLKIYPDADLGNLFFLKSNEILIRYNDTESQIIDLETEIANLNLEIDNVSISKEKKRLKGECEKKEIELNRLKTELEEIRKNVIKEIL